MMNEWILSSSLLIAAVLALRFALRGRISLRLQYGLWAVVLVRLLLPVQLFTSDLGAGAIAQSVDIAEPVRQVYVSANEDRYEREYSEAYRQVAAQYEALQQQFDQSYDPIVVEKTAQDLAQQRLELDLTQLLYHIWFAGMVVMTAVIVSCNLHLGLQLKRRRWEYPAADSLLPVYVTEAVPTPCIFGFFRPAVYLTPDAVKDDRVRDHVLAHELTHYRHLDHVWSVLRSICLVLHWYNPLVWIAAKVSRADAELACDEGALARLGESQRGDYGRTLIGLTCAAPIADLFVTATTMTGSAGSIRERIKLLMKRPRNTVLTVTAVILTVTLIVGCSFAGAPETAAPTESTPSHEGQELSIPADPTASDFKNADGVLVFPGTRWGMTEAELIDALDIQEYGVFSGMRGIHLPKATFCGYPASIAFYFSRYSSQDEWGLSSVQVDLQDEEAANAVYGILYEQLGRFDRQASGVSFTEWRSDSTLADLVSPEAYAIYQGTLEYHFENEAASIIYWYGSSPGNPQNTVSFSSDLHLALQIEAAIAPDNDMSYTEKDLPIADDPARAAYFDDLLNPDLYRSEADWYSRALTSCYDSPAGIDLFQLFYGGIPGADNTPSAEELAFLKDQPGYEPDFDLVRIPAKEMDRVLTEYFGITLADTKQIGLENFMYDPDTDCYYHCHTDTNLGFREVKSCEDLGSGLWRIGYTTPLGESCIVALQQTANGWLILFNLPAAEAVNQPVTPDQTEEVRALFAEGGDPWYLAVLTGLYADQYSFDAARFFAAGQSAVALADAEKSLGKSDLCK